MRLRLTILAVFLLLGAAYGQKALSPAPQFCAWDDNGNPLAVGKIYTYAAGTTTPATTYSDSTGTANANPVVLDGRGCAQIWLTPGTAYKFTIRDAYDVVIATVDNINASAAGSFSTLTASSTLTVSGASSLAAVSASGVVTSTVTTGTAPLVIASTTKVSNLNVDQLDGADWASPPATGYGSTAAAPVAATTLSAGSAKLTVDANGLVTKYNNVATVANGIPQLVAKYDATAQGANIAATDLLAAANVVAGMYRVSCYLVVTTADAVSSTLPNCLVSWTDPDANAAASSTLTATSTANTAGTVGGLTGNAQYEINAKVGTAIQISTANYASNTANAMKYAIHVKLEYLGN